MREPVPDPKVLRRLKQAWLSWQAAEERAGLGWGLSSRDGGLLVESRGS